MKAALKRLLKLISGHKGIIISLLVLVGVITFFYHGLITDPGLMNRSDAARFFSAFGEGERYGQWFQTWNSASLFGGPHSGLGNPMFSPLYFLMAKLHLTPSVSVYAFTLLLLGGVFGYLFVYYYTKNIYGSTVAGIFYAINWFVPECIVGAMPLLLGYVLFPMLFLLFDRALEKRRFKDVIFFSLFAFIFIASSHAHPIYIAFFTLALWAVFRLFVLREGKLSARFVDTTKICLISVALIAGLLCYQLIPTIAGVKSLSLSTSFVMEEAAMTAQVPWVGHFSLVTGPWSMAFTSNYFIFELIIVALALCAIAFRRDRYTIFFSIAVVVTLFLSKGPYSPFASVHEWLWDNFPAFDTFRSPRWGILTVLSYSFLLGVSVAFITTRFKGLRGIKLPRAPTCLSCALVGAVIAIHLLGVAPQFTYSLRGFDPNRYPVYVESEEAYNTMAAQDDGIYAMSRFYMGDFFLAASPVDPIADVPYHMTLNPIDWLYQLSGQPHLPDARHHFDPQLAGLSEYIESQVRNPSVPNLAGIMGALNVRYIVIDKVYRGSYIDFFQMQDGCSLLYDGETVAVIEYDSAVPHLNAAPTSAMLLGGLDSLSALQFIPEFDFGTVNLLLPNSLHNLDNMDFLILYNADASDFAMLNALESGGVQNLDIDKYAAVLWSRAVVEQTRAQWVISNWCYAQGDFVFDYLNIRTEGENAIEIPFSVAESGDYQMWLRIAFAPERGELDALVDGEELAQFPLTPEMDFYCGFKFVKVPLSLEKGDHVLELRNDGSGFNDVDEVFLVKSDALDSLFSAAAGNTPAGAVYYQEAEKLFGLENLGGWLICNYVGSTKVIADDELAQFWTVVDPGTSISDSAETKIHGSYSLKIAVDGEKAKCSSKLSHSFFPVADWSDNEAFSFYFYGNNTDTGFCLEVRDEEGNVFGGKCWIDDFYGWKQFIFTIDKQEACWSEVAELKIIVNPTSASGTWYLDVLELIKSTEPQVVAIRSGEETSSISADFRPLKEGDYMIAVRAAANEPREIIQYKPYLLIADDNQSDFWGVASPEQISISDSTAIKFSGSDSLQIVANGTDTPRWAKLGHYFIPHADFLDFDALSFYFYGNNSGYGFGIAVVDGNGEPVESFAWVDDFSGWRQFTFCMDKQQAGWSNVREMRIGIDQNPAEGTWYLDYLTLGRMELEKVGPSPEDARLYMKIGESDELVFEGFGTESRWLQAGPVTLDAESQTIEMSNEGDICLDRIVLYPCSSQCELGSLFNAHNPPSLSYEKISPTKYRIHVSTDEPFWLVFSEIYHPLWHAHVDGESIESEPTYLGFNTFYISEVGEYDMVLEFAGQRYLEYGGIISFITLGFMVVGGIYAEIRARRRNKGGKTR